MDSTEHVYKDRREVESVGQLFNQDLKVLCEQYGIKNIGVMAEFPIGEIHEGKQLYSIGVVGGGPLRNLLAKLVPAIMELPGFNLIESKTVAATKAPDDSPSAVH